MADPSVRQPDRFVGHLLDVLGGGDEQPVPQVGQGPGHRDLVADLRYVVVVRVQPRQPDAEQMVAELGVQPSLGVRLAVALAEEHLDVPSLRRDHRGPFRSVPRG
jgi:hypothetical protein